MLYSVEYAIAWIPPGNIQCRKMKKTADSFHFSRITRENMSTFWKDLRAEKTSEQFILFINQQTNDVFMISQATNRRAYS